MSEEPTYRMELQYDGTDLHGWAKQEGRPTVEGSLEAAFATAIGYVPALRVAGRTDAGVHARRQVVSLRLPAPVSARALVRSLNALTPPAVAVTSLDPAAPGFDARRDALGRSYRYFLQLGGVDSPFYSRYCWRVYETLDAALLERAAALTEGRHDFTAFTPTATEHTFFRRLVQRCVWRPIEAEPGRRLLCLEIEADAFLRHMVRSLVGTMVEVAAGSRGLEDFAALLEGAPREAGGLTAPAKGLFLWDVRYPEDAG